MSIALGHTASTIDINQLKRSCSIPTTHAKNITPASLIEQTIASISDNPQIKNILRKFSPAQIEEFIKKSNCKNHEGVVRVIKGLYEQYKDELTEPVNSVCFYQPKIAVKNKDEFAQELYSQTNTADSEALQRRTDQKELNLADQERVQKARLANREFERRLDPAQATQEEYKKQRLNSILVRA
ncbi:MAG: hypothetical protein LBD99_00665 [Candidatus Margulisbacteria bacterium]|jgi:hypothetical protein|nr:hypothetical protein [Candidatus Margulisiibacteriota bacterium]